ncbi:formylglycine-generating enzyme family protein [Bacteroidota bacterium]
MKRFIFSLLFFSLLNSAASPQESNNEPDSPLPSVKQELVLIEGGLFLMGKTANPNTNYVDFALHEVRVSDFYLDKYEVTNSQYYEFVQNAGHKLPEFWGMDAFCSGPKFPDHPVVGVTWVDAMKYAEWAGKRLPTEAEWEYAARGGLIQKAFPNGDNMDENLGNYNGTNGHPLAVGSFPANAFGLHDMAGNVVEWVQDYYAKDYFLESPDENPQGPEIGKRRVIKGGGWRSGKMCNACYFRQSLRPYWVDIGVGFRCAKDEDK